MSGSHASALADEQRILDCFVEDLRRTGHVGEERLAKIIYLAMTSRYLEKPLCVFVKGPSSAGKSETTKAVRSFFPEEACVWVTSLSPKSLVYSDEEFSHRILVVAEAKGISDGDGAYLVRSLVSEGEIRHRTVESTANGLQGREVHKEGPTGLILTTTDIKVHPENETRALTVSVDDSPEQTRQIMLAIAGSDGRSVDRRPWHDLHKWLGQQEVRAVVPFARGLAASIPPVGLRLRRDFETVLGFIRSHALLHQKNRSRNSDGAVMARHEDYVVVHELLHDLVAEGLEAQVSETVRETVDAVKGLGRRVQAVTITKLAKALQLDKSVVSRRVNQAVEAGYLNRAHSKPGVENPISLGEPLPEDQVVLPSPHALQELVDCCSVAANPEREPSRDPAPRDLEVRDDR